MIEERLIGFDVRETWMDSESLWDDARRSTYLLRSDAGKPLSTDPMVWPSVFDTGQGIGLPHATRARLGLAGVPVPEWTGPNSGLWESLEEMRRYLAANWAFLGRRAAIAVSWLSNDGFSSAGDFGPHLGATIPADRDPAWRLLGLDVADGSLVSGLTNCGYSPDEIDDLRRRWASHLNSAHLFDDVGRAFSFRDLSNTRVPTHAPFFVYGLYLIVD